MALITTGRNGGRCEAWLTALLLDDLWEDHGIDGHQVLVLVQPAGHGTFAAVIDEGRTFRHLHGSYVTPKPGGGITKTIAFGRRYATLGDAFNGGICGHPEIPYVRVDTAEPPRTETDPAPVVNIVDMVAARAARAATKDPLARSIARIQARRAVAAGA
jgi:hypothetical protein